MAILERVMQMQQQGMSDSEIAYNLQNEGISSKEIYDSLSQARIKTAINQPSQDYANTGYSENYPQQQYTQQQYVQQDSPQQSYDQNYQQQYQYPDQTQMNAQVISDIVDRLLLEKLKELNQKIKSVSDFKTSAEEDLKDLKERIKRIESSIDNLQRSVIGKVGEFGQSTSMIHKDLENIHGTMSKLMNPLVDNYNELKKLNSKKE